MKQEEKDYNENQTRYGSFFFGYAHCVIVCSAQKPHFTGCILFVSIIEQKAKSAQNGGAPVLCIISDLLTLLHPINLFAAF